MQEGGVGVDVNSKLTAHRRPWLCCVCVSLKDAPPPQPASSQLPLGFAVSRFPQPPQGASMDNLLSSFKRRFVVLKVTFWAEECKGNHLFFVSKICPKDRLLLFFWKAWSVGFLQGLSPKCFLSHSLANFKTKACLEPLDVNRLDSIISHKWLILEVVLSAMGICTITGNRATACKVETARKME